MSSIGIKNKQTAVNLAVMLLTGLMANNTVMAEPTGGVVKSGTATINTSGAAGQSTTTVNQNSNSLSLEWQSFNLGKSETVNFVQPSTNSVAINRILSASGSDIQGKINANGKVWLINPNGVFFGKDAQVNVGGLVATTLDNLSNTSGGQKFQGNSTASVENQGSLVSTNGYVILMGHTAKNLGTIKADGGAAALAAGSDITLQFQNNNKISVVVNQNQLNALASNGGLMQADGGQVLLNAGASNSVLAAAVNNSGVLQAKSTVSQNGKIALSADGLNSRLDLAGTLDASASGNLSGGSIETKASIVKVAGTTQVKTNSMSGNWGKWIVTQNNSDQIAADANLSSIFSGNVLNNILDNTNVTIATKKDITVDIPVEWAAASKLTLSADSNIAVNAPLTANDKQGSLALEYGQGSRNGSIGGSAASYVINAKVNLKEGENFSTQLGTAGTKQDYYVITKLGEKGSTTGQDLQGMNGNLLRNYALGGDIDATATANWGAFSGGSGFNPIGGTSIDDSFKGIFTGLGHTVNGLSIKAPDSDVIGMFGYVYKTVIRDVGLTNVSINGKKMAGALVGLLDRGTINNSYTSGVVNGEANVGGLVGLVNNSGLIINSHSSANVTGTGDFNGVGGLAGQINSTQIINSYSTGNVTGLDEVGGLVGYAYNSTIDQSYSLSLINNNGGGKSGGLVGLMQYSTIRTSFADVIIKGNSDSAGGLVGNALSNNIISNSYAVGSVEGENFAGGLIGNAGKLNTINNSFSSVNSKSNNKTGGLIAVANNQTNIQNSYWDISKNTQGYGFLVGSTTTNTKGLTTAQLMQKSSFASFDMANEWVIYEGHTMPMLQSFMTPITLKMNASQGQTYNASVQYNGIASIENQDEVNKLLNDQKIFGQTNYVLASKNAGTQAVIDNGLYSSQLGYLIKFDTSQSQVDVAKAAIVVNGISAENKVYDGTQTAQLKLDKLQNTGVFAADQGTVSINFKGTFDSKNVGDGKAVQIESLTEGLNGSNYYVTGQTGSTANITPASYTAVSGSKTYDGNNQFSNISLTGVNGEKFLLEKATSNSANASANTVRGATVFTQAEGVKEIAGDLGKTSNYLPFDANQLSQIKSNQALINQAEYSAISGSKVYDGNTTFKQAVVTGVNNESFTIEAVANSKNASSNAVDPAKQFVSLSGTLTAANGTSADVGNYKELKLDKLNSNQALITPKSITVVGITAENKIYDGNTNVALDTSKAFNESSGIVKGDDVNIKNVVGQFSDKNAGTNKNVALSNAVYEGLDKDNYQIVDQTQAVATISKATLTYEADKTTRYVNQTISELTGKVTGFVAEEKIETAATGALSWTTNANKNSPAGTYAVIGSGLMAKNYQFVQAASNSSALNLQAPPQLPTVPPKVPVIETQPKLPPNNVIPPIANNNNPVAKIGSINSVVAQKQFYITYDDFEDLNCSFMKSVGGKSMNCRSDRKVKPDQINNLNSLVKKANETKITLR